MHTILSKFNTALNLEDIVRIYNNLDNRAYQGRKLAKFGARSTFTKESGNKAMDLLCLERQHWCAEAESNDRSWKLCILVICLCNTHLNIASTCARLAPHAACSSRSWQQLHGSRSLWTVHSHTWLRGIQRPHLEARNTEHPQPQSSSYQKRRGKVVPTCSCMAHRHIPHFAGLQFVYFDFCSPDSAAV